jgi:ribosome-associated translation inhibitor RaiA
MHRLKFTLKGIFMSKTSNVVVQFRNFHPSEPTQEFINSVLEEVQQELPSGSTVKATFTTKDNVIKGMLRVGSYAGPFFAVATSENSKEVIFKLLEQMRRRIEKFKSKSHARKSIRHIGYENDLAYDFATGGT